MPRPPLALVSDFDGTMVTKDIGDEICLRHAPGPYEAFDRDWRGGKVTLIEGQRRIWPEVRLSREAFERTVDEVAEPRAGLAGLMAACRRRGSPFVIASNGFEEYIRRALTKLPASEALSITAIWANRLSFTSEGRLAPSFPHTPRFGCGACGVCKGKVIELLKAEGFQVAFCGDGGSDRCAAGKADRLFAIAGATFARHLDEQRVPYEPFTSFDEVRAALSL